jgi:hypothetical protein
MPSTDDLIREISQQIHSVEHIIDYVATLPEFCGKNTPEIEATNHVEEIINRFDPPKVFWNNRQDWSRRNGESNTNEGKIKPRLIDPSKVEKQPIRWLWENRIALGMLTLIAGMGGLGKTFWTVYLTAVITNGWDWADGKKCEKGSVIFFYGEDGLADTLKARFEANGVKEENVRILDGAEYFNSAEAEGTEVDFTLARLDVIALAIDETTRQTGLPVKMIVVDPISNYWGDVNENHNAEVRSVLKPLARLAEQRNISIVSIQHTGKSTDKEYAQHRILGSTGIVAAHRSVFGVYPTKSETGDKHLLFAPVKNNIAINPTSIKYVIHVPDGQVQIIDCEVEKNGDDIERENRLQFYKPEKNKLDDCVKWLQDYIGTEEKPAADIYDTGKAKDFSKSTIDRAKKELEIKSKKTGFQGTFLWSLPDENPKGTQDTHVHETLSTFGTENNANAIKQGVQSKVLKIDTLEKKEGLSTFGIEPVPVKLTRKTKIMQTPKTEGSKNVTKLFD